MKVSVPLSCVRGLGVALWLCCAAVPPVSGAQTPASSTAGLFLVHSFNPPVGAAIDDARVPYAPPLLSRDGRLYGVGSAGPALSFRGAAYRCDLNGDNYELLFFFDDTDSRVPQSGFIEGADGTLYGTAPFGNSPGLFGSLYSFTPDGTGYRLLHNFTNAPDGANPSAGVIEGPQDFVYGVTEKGGTNGSGTVFRTSKDGTRHEILRHFRSTGGDGKRPVQGLVLGSDGQLYGTTFAGGPTEAGTLFAILPDGGGYRILHGFGSVTADGAAPGGPLLEKDGFLYGVASSGGVKNHGVVFRLRVDGTSYEVLHRFQGAPTEGHAPYGRLVEGVDGRLYGTTLQGGAADAGTIYRLNRDGSAFEVAWSFARSQEQGQLPQSGLVPGPAGEMYGTTTGGGAFGFGSLYRFHAPVRLEARLDGQDWVLEWAENGLDYLVFGAESLDVPDAWLDIGATVTLEGQVHHARVPAIPSNRFLRLQASP